MAQYAFTLLLGVNLLFADIFIVSYQAQVKDAQLVHQSLLASRAMQLTNKSISKSTIIALDQDCLQEKFFSCYEEEILDFLFKQGVHVDARETTQGYVAQSSFVELNLPPQYIQVEFNDTFVKMALLK